MKNEIRVKTWEDCEHEIQQIEQANTGSRGVWFRGHAKASYNLVPSLFRFPQGVEKEQALFNEYERSAAYLIGEKKNDWETLNDMQHYGLPTRLLDWTEVLGNAIAFALYDSGDDSFDSAIYLLDPLALNALSGLKEVKRAPSDSEFGYKAVYWHGRPFYPNFPIAIDGTLHNSRLRAQNGSFTVQGRVADALEMQAESVVRKVIL